MNNTEIGIKNQMIQCKLRIQSCFGMLCGNNHYCLMTKKSMNITFNKEKDDIVDCNNCPDSIKRDELLEFYKDQSMCSQCNINMATLRKKIRQFYSDQPITFYKLKVVDVCIGCVNG